MIKNDFKISFELLEKSEFEKALPFIEDHLSNTSPKLIKERLCEMLKQGMELIGIFSAQQNSLKLIGISGLWTQTRLYSGRCLEPDNVYISPQYRSKGIGNELMLWIEALAKTRKTEAIELNCYLENKKGQKFWEESGFKALGYHYQKKLI